MKIVFSNILSIFMKIKKLIDFENYLKWNRSFIFICKFFDLWKYIIDESNKTFKWIKNNKICLKTFRNIIENNFWYNIKNCAHFKQIYNKFKKLNMSRDFENLNVIYVKVDNFRFIDCKNALNYNRQFRDVINELTI